MTLAAAHFIQGWPILIGDVLISSRKEYANRKVTLPTIHYPIPEEESKNDIYAPKGLNQKLVIIDSKLVVGWAGVKIYAQSFIKAFKSEYANKNSSLAQILKYLDNIDGEIRDKISIVGIMQFDNTFNCFGFNLIRVNSPQLAAKGLFLIGALIPRSLLRGSSFVLAID